MEEDNHSSASRFSRVRKEEDRHANPIGNVKHHYGEEKELKVTINREPVDIPMASSLDDTGVPSYPQASVKPNSQK